MKDLEWLFEGSLWNSRLVILSAVMGSLIVTLFEHVLNMKLDAPIDLLYLGGSVALIALALYLTHAAEHGVKPGEGEPGESIKRVKNIYELW